MSWGPAYVETLDGPRLRTQLERVWTLIQNSDEGRTLGEIENALGYPQASVSAQLRHLRKPEHGSHLIIKRRRANSNGLWEYKHHPRHLYIWDGQCECGAKPPQAWQEPLFR